MPDDSPQNATIGGGTQLKAPQSQLQGAVNNLSSEVDMLQDVVMTLVKRLQPVTSPVATAENPNKEGIDRAPRSEFVENIDGSAGRIRQTRNIVNILLENLEV